MFINLSATGILRTIYLMGLYYGSWLFEPLRRTLTKIILLPFSRKAVWLVSILLGLLIVSIIMNQVWLFLVFFSVIGLASIWVVYSRLLKPVIRYRYWETHKNEMLEHNLDNHIFSIEDLGLNTNELVNLRRKIELKGEVVIADIDQDGFFLSRIGPIPGIHTIQQEKFIRRRRNALQLVAVKEIVGIRKIFNHWKTFLTELEILHTLSGKCNVPALLAVDFDELTIIFSFIPGTVIRRELARRGAKILHRDLDIDQHYQRLQKNDKRRIRIQAAKQVMSDFVDDNIKNKIFSELQDIHKAGVLIHDIKYGNIILEKESGTPYFIDFDFAQQYGYPGGLQGEVKRDLEIERFNYIFDADKPTRRRIFNKFSNSYNECSHFSGQSVNFGNGLTSGKTWNIDFGEGLWNYLVFPNLPGIQEKRILDLGFQDPLFSIRILLAGAKEVVSIESEENVNQYRRFLKQGFEWSNNSTLNLEIINSSLDKFQELSLGTFDIAIAGENFFHQPRKIIPELIRMIRSVCKMVVVIHGKTIDHESDGNGCLVNDKKIPNLLVSNGFQLAGEVIPPLGDKMLTIME